jgi:hypothetical protein
MPNGFFLVIFEKLMIFNNDYIKSDSTISRKTD